MKDQEIKKVRWTIGEVAEAVKINQPILRKWEDEFPWLKTKRGRNGVRVYHENNIQDIIHIKVLHERLGMSYNGIRRAHGKGYFYDLFDVAKKSIDQDRALSNKLEKPSQYPFLPEDTFRIKN